MIWFLAGLIFGAILASLFTALILKRASAKYNSTADKFAELGKLTGRLAHEIKNPLSTIKVHLKLIAENLESKKQPTERALRKIEVVQAETDRVEHILADFLKYIGSVELKTEPVDINQLLREMADFYLPQARDNSITLRLGICEESLICKADVDMIKQVFLNLFINAQQAMPDGGELILRTQRKENNALINISDTGKGISQDALPRIFEAYYSTKPGGSGLGLSTSKKIIDIHMGKITAQSEPEKGTSFEIELPLA